MEKIKANIIFEMLGRPPEHLKETMKQFLETVEKDTGIKIVSQSIHEPKKIESKEEHPLVSGEIYSTFSEIKIETEDLFKILGLGFKYMPSHIEIEEPFDFKISNLDMNSIMNEILTKLHNYDSIAKSALMNNQMLAKKLQEVMPQNRPPTNKLDISYGKKEDSEEKVEKKSKKKKA